MEESFETELALELDEKEENVQVTIQFLKAAGLLEVISPDEYYLTEAAELISGETASALRMRRLRQRENIKALPSQSDAQASQCDTDVTESDADVTQSDKNVRKRDTAVTTRDADVRKSDIDIDKDIGLRIVRPSAICSAICQPIVPTCEFILFIRSFLLAGTTAKAADGEGAPPILAVASFPAQGVRMDILALTRVVSWVPMVCAVFVKAKAVA